MTVRAMVLPDKQTHMGVDGCRIVEYPDELDEYPDDAIQAACEGDQQDAEGVRIIYTFNGAEPPLDLEQLDTSTLVGLARALPGLLAARAQALEGTLVRQQIDDGVRVIRVQGSESDPSEPVLYGTTVEHPAATLPAGEQISARLGELLALED